MIFRNTGASASSNLFHAPDILYEPFASNASCGPTYPWYDVPIDLIDVELMHFSLNLEFLEAEHFLNGALGYGLDKVAAELVLGGPPPIGAMKANLDNLTKHIITEFGYQEVGHVRAIHLTVGGFPRPLLNLSSYNFATIMDEAFGYHLDPPFDPYANSINYMLASYVIPYMGLVGYVGANPFLKGYITKRLLAGLLGVECGQDAVIRMYLYERGFEVVHPYNHTVAEFTIRITELRNRLAMCGTKDEGLNLPPELGSENRTCSNVLSADPNSLSYARTPPEILRVVYGSGNEHIPGGFFPAGGNGRIARSFQKMTCT
ncbi:Desiccation-related protein pcc13-62 [Thalictrum thalictroides]|uniref:Desiccation-related protein pcc13-62 n=1 Tax=Thalictrum thalictroides TaxID=46969 RepID=A0A7J6WB11_THATH|nr:Desiccation-related protein pcc13-62 [Thalictrum thalictroides]